MPEMELADDIVLVEATSFELKETVTLVSKKAKILV